MIAREEEGVAVGGTIIRAPMHLSPAKIFLEKLTQAVCSLQYSTPVHRTPRLGPLFGQVVYSWMRESAYILPEQEVLLPTKH